MRRGVPAFVVVTLMLAGLVAAPDAPAKAKPCKAGTLSVKLGKRSTCVKTALALPAPANVAPALAQLQGALALTQVGFKTRSGKHAAPLAKHVGHSWNTVRARLLKAMSAVLAKIETRLPPDTATRATDPNDVCFVADLASRGGSLDIAGQHMSFGGSYTSNGVGISIGQTSSGGMEFGMKTTSNGDTYTLKYESGESDCMKYTLPPCPQADGSLDAFGRKGKVGLSMTVERGGKVLSKRSYAKTTTVETKGQVADDAKLDYVDVRYGENTVIVNDGVRFTSNGTRSTRIDMRSGQYEPGDSGSIGSANIGGDLANTTGIEADAADFAAFVGKTISNYRQRETAWQSPGTCATLTFNPAKNSITVQSGATGTFSAQAIASNGGGAAAKARWTLSSQQNGTFSPDSTNDAQPTFNYTVSAQPSGTTLSVTVRATSTAGVAEDTWTQPINGLRTISGTFTGHSTDAGVIYDWTGTATFTRNDTAGVPGPGGVFQLSSGQATVTVSGSQTGSGCDQTGTSTIGLFPQSPWTVSGSDAPFSYQIIAPFNADVPQATNVHCSNASQNGTPAGLGSMVAAALQSGDIAGGANPTGLIKTTSDLYTYSGSASTTGPDAGESANWTWSFTGSP